LQLKTLMGRDIIGDIYEEINEYVEENQSEDDIFNLNETFSEVMGTMKNFAEDNYSEYISMGLFRKIDEIEPDIEEFNETYSNMGISIDADNYEDFSLWGNFNFEIIHEVFKNEYIVEDQEVDSHIKNEFKPIEKVLSDSSVDYGEYSIEVRPAYFEFKYYVNHYEVDHLHDPEPNDYFSAVRDELLSVYKNRSKIISKVLEFLVEKGVIKYVPFPYSSNFKMEIPSQMRDGWELQRMLPSIEKTINDLLSEHIDSLLIQERRQTKFDFRESEEPEEPLFSDISENYPTVSLTATNKNPAFAHPSFSIVLDLVYENIEEIRDSIHDEFHIVEKVLSNESLMEKFLIEARDMVVKNKPYKT
jgi:hypothetical protein